MTTHLLLNNLKKSKCETVGCEYCQLVSPPQELFLKVEAATPSTGKPIAMVSNRKHTHRHTKGVQQEVELHYDYLC